MIPTRSEDIAVVTRHRPHPGPGGRRAGRPGACGLRQEAQRQL